MNSGMTVVNDMDNGLADDYQGLSSADKPYRERIVDYPSS
jgi:hypothetical protein